MTLDGFLTTEGLREAAKAEVLTRVIASQMSQQPRDNNDENSAAGGVS